MADLPFVDTHVHFYDLKHPALRWVWLEPDFVHPNLGDIDPLKAQRYGVDEFMAETRFQNVSKVIHVQAALGSPDPVEETRWLQVFADRTDLPQAIVAEAWLANPNVGDMLERHAEFPNLRGIRDLRYDDYLTNGDWLRGFAELERFGLVFCDDPLVEQMPLLADLARRHPGQAICVDHAGFPRRRGDEYSTGIEMGQPDQRSSTGGKIWIDREIVIPNAERVLRRGHLLSSLRERLPGSRVGNQDSGARTPRRVPLD